jgi:aerobic carbon-monoxide dehydrogenase large subunit
VSAFSNAVNDDTFAHLGLTHTQMPHDHWRVWKTARQLGLAAD